MKTTTLHKLMPFALAAVAVLPVHAKYAVFERRSDTIQIAGQTLLDQAGTYEAVFMLPTAQPHGGGIIFREVTASQEDKTLGANPRSVAGYNYIQGANGSLNLLAAFVPVSLGVWHHVAFVSESSEERVYLDGQLVASQPRLGPIQNGPGTAVLGTFLGVLDSVRLSDTARYSGVNFIPPSGDFAADEHTVLLYNFNEQPGSVAVEDGSRFHRTGTLGVGFDGATAPQLVESLEDAPAPLGMDVIIDPRATYLRINSDRAHNSIPIPLASLGLAPGDVVFLQEIGGFNRSGDVQSDFESWAWPMAAVFSSSSTLGTPTERNRVPGAVGAGRDYVTPATNVGALTTDIPEDFQVPRAGVFVTVPSDAKFLFVAAVDAKYQDNLDRDGDFGVHASKMTLGMRRSEGALVFNWDAGVLQSKMDIAGPWTDQPGTLPAQPVAEDRSAAFFRLRSR